MNRFVSGIAGHAARRLLGAAVLALAAGCNTMTPKVSVLEPTSVRPEPTTATAAAISASRAPQANGAIYHPSSFRGLFEDRRARLVGDLLTIQIQEKTSARSSSNSSLDRNSSIDASIAKLPFVKGTSSLIPKLGVGGSSANTFEGKGETGSDNLFSGTIAVTVVEVLPNGNLVVSGEKQVGINQNVEVLRFSGVINPATVLPGNVVTSTQVADARLEVRGRGDMDRAHTVGWLSRFFLSFLPI
ncbi:MAG: flagellar basal body L-ring protein FlgH [Burkholderiales bacterium]|nr:flagellar basal body L-ring protein FlgH [Burkholderiales bacterium]